MISYIQQAILLNNQAVSILSNTDSLQGDCHGYTVAISHLSNALSTIKTVISMTDGDASPSSARPMPLLVGASMSIDDCMDLSIAEAFQLHDSQLSFFYRTAIAIPTKASIDLNMLEDRIMILCIIIFNLALAQHNFSMTTKNTENRLLALGKACRLYELAFNLHRNELETCNDLLFRLAIINNLGLVHKSFEDEEAATKCFQVVLSTLIYLVDQGHATTFPIDNFFLNTTYLVCGQSVAPAA
jgi:hypothetical protein